ncbi:hypothetical protein EI74_0582 [Mycoplasma testudineum]|uniref:DUF16 domain-containing protein n=1 Tax=Mycoplasma testudineum TaxID=244584 RepID=A0A4V3C2U8_9MOLU|nr:hypothetical protein [Mycoplasma testudineum]OYD26650.1 hypothetical protein CG473_02510 [Mycoplasma testudineum]TDO19779.1 hypothetical protein EI74_0582 [Mycoplasma testudineum]
MSAKKEKDKHEFEKFLKMHNINETGVINSRKKWDQLYSWNNKPIEFSILEDYQVKIDSTLRYNGTSMRNLNFEKEVLVILGELRNDIKILKEDVAILKQDVAMLKEEVEILKSDVSVLKQFHNI